MVIAMNSTEPKKILGVAEIARELEISAATVAAWCDSGKLPAVDVSKTQNKNKIWRVLRTDLDAFLDSRRNKASKAKTANRVSESLPVGKNPKAKDFLKN